MSLEDGGKSEREGGGNDDYKKYSWVWCNNQQNSSWRNELQVLTFHFKYTKKKHNTNKQTNKLNKDASEMNAEDTWDQTKEKEEEKNAQSGKMSVKWKLQT